MTHAIDTPVIAFGDKPEQHHAADRTGDSKVRSDSTTDQHCSSEQPFCLLMVLCTARTKSRVLPPVQGVLSLELQWADPTVASISVSRHDVTQCNMVSGKSGKTQVGTNKSNVFVQQILKNVFVGL